MIAVLTVQNTSHSTTRPYKRRWSTCGTPTGLKVLLVAHSLGNLVLSDFLSNMSEVSKAKTWWADPYDVTAFKTNRSGRGTNSLINCLVHQNIFVAYALVPGPRTSQCSDNSVLMHTACRLGYEITRCVSQFLPFVN